MGFHKATKFPIEVTKGKSRELFQLRFMRKSELESNLRHNFRLNVCQMGRQLDIWFKEQVYTLGSLNREQEKFYQSHRRLRKEIRQAKKREYARRQEEIRQKLHGIKVNMMAMKVIHKWRSNVRQSKLESQLELEQIRDAVRKADLKIGNKPQGSMNSNEINEKQATETDGIYSSRSKRDDTNGHTNIVNALDERLNGSGFDDNNLVSRENGIYSDDSDIDSGPDAEDYIPDNVDLVNGSRYPSSQGPRMETIPEEAQETELDIKDHRELPRLTKRRLSLLNRSQSKRDVFDETDQVPLLPDLGVHNIKPRPHHSPPDTVDAETQTSEKLRPPKASKKKGKHLKNKSNTAQAENIPKKKIVVKLPSNDFQSRDNHRQAGDYNDDVFYSDGSDSDYDPDEDVMFTRHQNSDTDGEYDENDADHVLPPTTHALPRGNHRALVKYKTTLHRTTSIEYVPVVQNIPAVNNIEPDLPPASPIGNHSPFPIHYKERSFHVRPEYYDYSLGNTSPRTPRSKFNNDVDAHNRTPRNGWRSTDDMKQRLESENHPHLSSQPKIAIFGRKPNSVAESTTPPNSPSPNTSQVGMKGMWRNGRSHTSNVLYTQKRAKAEEQQKIHDAVVKEPVQQYERTRSGRIRPLGTPRSPSQDLKVPSFKEQYYRHKLLKSERDSILKQNIKMKRFMNFMDAFKKERNTTVLPPITRDSVDESDTDSTTTENKPKRTIGSLFFKVQQSEQDPLQKRKVVPGAATTSLRLLKDCRYLREYKPMSVQEKMALYPDKESSWNMQNTAQSSVTNVSVDSK